MAKYLDQTGLTYFWGKVKGWVNNSQHPVGSIYISTSSTFNPQTTWGGTWRKTADGRCLIGANSTYPLGSTGGSASHSHSSGAMVARVGPYGTGFTMNIKGVGAWTSDWTYNVSKATQESRQNAYAARIAGNTDGASSMQPYLAVYIWERTA